MLRRLFVKIASMTPLALLSRPPQKEVLTADPCPIEWVSPDGTARPYPVSFQLFVDPETNRFGLHNMQSGDRCQIPLDQVVEILARSGCVGRRA
jgi:hypothetical protein